MASAYICMWRRQKKKKPILMNAGEKALLSLSLIHILIVSLVKDGRPEAVEAVPEPAEDTVSYTHLDVYKRQVWNRSSGFMLRR